MNVNKTTGFETQLTAQLLRDWRGGEASALKPGWLGLFLWQCVAEPCGKFNERRQSVKTCQENTPLFLEADHCVSRSLLLASVDCLTEP